MNLFNVYSQFDQAQQSTFLIAVSRLQLAINNKLYNTDHNKQSKTNQKNTFNAEIKKMNVYQDKENLHEFFEENHYIHQEFMNESSHEVYKIYEDSEESYSEIFTDINMMIAESTHHCHKCKTSFVSHNKLHDHIHIKCKLLILSSSSTVSENSESTIIKSVIKSKKLSEYSFRK